MGMFILTQYSIFMHPGIWDHTPQIPHSYSFLGEPRILGSWNVIISGNYRLPYNQTQ